MNNLKKAILAGLRIINPETGKPIQMREAFEQCGNKIKPKPNNSKVVSPACTK